jgi:NADH dehydrogenase
MQKETPGSAPHVVIIGGGFAGLLAAKGLGRAPVRLTVLDRKNHHVFQPLLYQVATAGLNPSDIAVPIRSILRHQRNTEVFLGEVKAIDRARRAVRFGDEEISYDYLIVATGATHSYFGHEQWATHAPGLKTLEDAVEIRRRVLVAYEAAERERDLRKREAWMTFVVVGGGPTGVELAGALAEIAQHTLSRDFRHIEPHKARIILVEASDRVLPVYPAALSEKAVLQLKQLGAEVRVNAMVTGIDEDGVTFAKGAISARTVLWAAGVKASPLAQSLGATLDRAGRVEVTPELTLPGDDRVFVIGDLAAVKQDGGMVPGVAPAAMQQGRHTAKNIVRAVRGESLLPFRYRDKGSLATIGKAAGVADFGRIRLSGFIAWFAWLTIHIFFLIGFRNRIVVFIQWAFAYLTYERSARLITGETRDLLK